MNIVEALQLRKGDLVRCPSDRGNPEYVGRVIEEFVGGKVHKNLKEKEYIWVLIASQSGHKETWPSNRLE
jgi:hypothetical protein